MTPLLCQDDWHGPIACANWCGRILADQAAADAQQPRIKVGAPWTDIVDIAQRLIDRRFVVKAVLELE